MKKTITHYFCDICKKENNVHAIKYPVLRQDSSFFVQKDIDVCDDCLKIISKVFTDGGDIFLSAENALENYLIDMGIEYEKKLDNVFDLRCIRGKQTITVFGFNEYLVSDENGSAKETVPLSAIKNMIRLKYAKREYVVKKEMEECEIDE